MNKQTIVSALTPKQVLVIATILSAAEQLPENHVERKPLKFSPDVFNRLKKDELVGAHGKFVWVTKKGHKAYLEAHGAAAPNTELEQKIADAAAKVELVPKSKPAKKVKSGPTLDWAYRRLRRQAFIYYSQNMDDEAKKDFRAELESLPHSYKALSNHLQRFDDFLEWFFGHEIHPGSKRNS